MTTQKTTVKEYIEWTNLRWLNAPDTVKPRVLLVGDSIVVGHGEFVFELLKDKVCIDYLATAKCVSDSDYMTELDYMLSRNNYAIIIFNNGLHGWDIDDTVYAENMSETLTYLKTKTGLLVWRNSTPIRTVGNVACFEVQRNPRVVKRNTDVAKIANKLDLPVLDLYALMAENPDFFFEDAVHYTQEGYKAQAKTIAAFINQRLVISPDESESSGNYHNKTAVENVVTIINETKEV